MIEATFKFPLVFELYRQQLEGAEQEMGRFLESTMRGRLQQEVDARLGQSPGPVVYPIQWTTPKQQRAFFATDGFGGGIPTTRTGAILNSWQVIVGIPENTIGLRNPHPAAQFVIGTFQQRFHANTGYAREDIIAFEILKSPDLLELLGDGWASIVDIGKSLA